MRFSLESSDWNYFSAIQVLAEALTESAAATKQAQSQQDIEQAKQRINKLIKQLSLFSDQYSSI